MEQQQQTKDRLKAIMAKGIRIDYIVMATGIKKNTIYSFNKDKGKPLSENKLNKINSFIDKLERIIEQ